MSAEPVWSGDPLPGAPPDLRPSPVSVPAEPELCSGPRVAYVMSRYPRLTETFIVTEATAMRRRGAQLSLHPLHHEHPKVVQPAAADLAPIVDGSRLVSPRVVATLASGLVSGRGVGRVGREVIRGNWGSRRLLTGAVASFPFAVDLARRLEADNVEHLHCHFATHPAAVGFTVSRLTGIPFSFTAHGSDLHRDKRMLQEKVEAAAFVVAVSEHNREVIIATCGEHIAHKVHVVRCGIDQQLFPERPLRFEVAGPTRILCTGTLHEVKGQRHLIDACAELVARGADVRCVLVGEGPDRSALEDQIRRLGLEGIVELAGACTQPEVLRLLEEADVVAVPSVPSADGRREGLPVVILEAMSVGVPVVASRLSGIPEVVVHEHTGLLVEPGDAYGLACAIGRLISERGMEASVVAGAHRTIRESFDPDRCADQLLDAIRGSAP